MRSKPMRVYARAYSIIHILLASPSTAGPLFPFRMTYVDVSSICFGGQVGLSAFYLPTWSGLGFDLWVSVAFGNYF